MKFAVLLRRSVCFTGLFAALSLGLVSWRPERPRKPVSPPEAKTELISRIGDTSLADMIERVTPAVVSIYTLHAPSPAGSSGDGPGSPGIVPKSDQGIGSGIVIRSDGVIVTNNHVVESSAEVKVVLWDRREMRAKIVGQDPLTDIAVLKVDAGMLPTVVLGDSRRARVGDSVLAIGNPLGIGLTVSRGILSAKGRTDLGLVDDEDFLQTDAAVNPGNSGGPLLNLQGEVIGMNSAIASWTGGFQGIGFAIPSGLVTEIMKILLSEGRIRRGELGVFMQDLTPALARALEKTPARGVIITGLNSRGAAREAGLRRRDIVLGLDGTPVNSASELRHKVAMRGGGAEVKLEVWRDGRILQFTLKLKERHEPPSQAPECAASVDEPEGWPTGLQGIRVSSISSEMLDQCGIHDEEGGLIVISLPAVGTFTGLKCGDVIVEVDGEAIHSITGLREAAHHSGDPVLMRIRRRFESIYISIPK